MDYWGARHHVMNRASRKEAFLLNDACCALFIDVLAEVPTRFHARIHGYALMPNHYHLMIEVPQGNLSEVMQFVGGAVTQRYNRASGRDGSLFRGRFKNRVVEEDAYWQHLLAYLHLNPVRAGLVRRPEECVWTSHNVYVGDSSQDWLTTSELIASFGSRERVQRYVEDVRLHRISAPKAFDSERLWSDANSDVLPEPPPPQPRTVEQALAEAAGVLGVQPVRLLQRENRGSRTSSDSWIAVWWVLQSTNTTRAALGRRMGVSAGRVSQLAAQARALGRRDRRVRILMEQLEAGRFPPRLGPPTAASTSSPWGSDPTRSTSNP